MCLTQVEAQGIDTHYYLDQATQVKKKERKKKDAARQTIRDIITIIPDTSMEKLTHLVFTLLIFDPL